MSGYTLNCGHCGRFVPGRQADGYEPWGHSGMQEPPDPVDLCPSCADDIYRRALARALAEGLSPYHARPYFGPPACWMRARAVARAMFRHGHPRPVRHSRARHAMTGTRMVWWCACGRPEKHPAHDLTEARRLSIRYCRFEKRHGRNIGTTKVQEWCTCGWTTGPLVPDDTRQVDYLMMGRLLREHIEAATHRALGVVEVAA